MRINERLLSARCLSSTKQLNDLTMEDVADGPLQTVFFAQTLKKPYCIFQLDQISLEEVASELFEWLARTRCVTLNVAGPREEKRPGIYASVFCVLDLSWHWARQPMG